MNILVCVEGPHMSRTSRAAVAAALGLGSGSSVTVVSAGKDAKNAALAEALSLGVPRAVHVLDRALIDADFQSLGPVLAAVARRLEATLILTGAESEEGSGSAPAAVAHHLGAVVLARVESLAPDPQNAEAVLVTVRGGGRRRKLRVRLPAVLSIAGSAAPEDEAAESSEAAKAPPAGAPVPEILSLRDLGIDSAHPPRRPDVVGTLVSHTGKPAAVDSAEELLRHCRPRG